MYGTCLCNFQRIERVRRFRTHLNIIEINGISVQTILSEIDQEGPRTKSPDAPARGIVILYTHLLFYTQTLSFYFHFAADIADILIVLGATESRIGSTYPTS